MLSLSLPRTRQRNRRPRLCGQAGRVPESAVAKQARNTPPGRAELNYVPVARRPHRRRGPPATHAGRRSGSSNPEPRVVSSGDLAGVVRGLEDAARAGSGTGRRTGIPLLLAGVELERCHDLSPVRFDPGPLRIHRHTGYAQAAEKLTQDDELPSRHGPCSRLPAARAGRALRRPRPGLRSGQSPEDSAPNSPPSRRRFARPTQPRNAALRRAARPSRLPATAGGSGSSCCSRPNRRQP